LCVLDVVPGGFEVIELASGVSREQVSKQTEAPVRFSDTVR
jgi:acyl CoA:acetate/3-ketoacid CoA transferase beta subunit